MKRTRSIALIVAGTLLPTVASAQIPELQTGLRLRVDASPVMRPTIVGTLMSRSGDTLVIASSAAEWHRVHTSAIRRIDESGGQSRIAGALKGILVFGIATGALTFAVMAPGGVEPGKVAFSVAIAGSVLGGVIGFVLRSESWERVYPKPSPAERGGVRRSPYGTS